MAIAEAHKVAAAVLVAAGERDLEAAAGLVPAAVAGLKRLPVLLSHNRVLHSRVLHNRNRVLHNRAPLSPNRGLLSRELLSRGSRSHLSRGQPTARAVA